MADVFLARVESPEGLARNVVVKQVLPNLARNGVYVRMFLDEARLAASLQHANIVQVHEVGEDSGNYFIAMEHLHGQDLSRICDRLVRAGRRMPLEQTLHIALAVCGGLHHAHEQRLANGGPAGIVHRDVSPQNVFVTYDGHVKLVDFGIARAAFREKNTAVGFVRGKTGYLSPEQLRSQQLDRRADVFSLSVVLWELVTGQRLFEGDDSFAVMHRVANTDAPLASSVRPDIDPRLDRIIARGLARDREGRYPSADAMAEELEAFARNSGAVMSQRTLGALVGELFPEDRELPHTPTPVPMPTAAEGPHDTTMQFRAATVDETPSAPSAVEVHDTAVQGTPEEPVVAPRRRRMPMYFAGFVAVLVLIAIALWEHASADDHPAATDVPVALEPEPQPASTLASTEAAPPLEPPLPSAAASPPPPAARAPDVAQRVPVPEAEPVPARPPVRAKRRTSGTVRERPPLEDRDAPVLP